MNKLLMTALCAGLMLSGLHASADDMAKPSDANKKQAQADMMKDCMAKEEMKKDGMTKEQMKQSCKEQLKSQHKSMPRDESKY